MKMNWFNPTLKTLHFQITRAVDYIYLKKMWLIWPFQDQHLVGHDLTWEQCQIKWSNGCNCQYLSALCWSAFTFWVLLHLPPKENSRRYLPTELSGFLLHPPPFLSSNASCFTCSYLAQPTLCFVRSNLIMILLLQLLFFKWKKTKDSEAASCWLNWRFK